MKNTFIPLDIAFINEEGIIESIKELDPMNPIPVYPEGDIRYAIEVNRGWFAENGIEVGDIILEDTEETEIDLNEVKDRKGKGSGTKDACYHKVKSRYSVWPSAYASGALVKCRKVGAANWGNSTKKEEYIPEEGYDVARDMGKVRPSKDKKDGTSYPPSAEMRKTQKVNKGPSALDRVKKKYKGQIMDLKKEEVELDEKCWKGYEKKGMKTMFGKRYPNCVKKEEYSDWRDELEYVDEAASKAITLGIKGAVAGGKAVAKKVSRKAVRAGIKVGGKQGGKAVKKAGKVAATETKKAAAETAGAVGAGAAKGLKKRKRSL